MIFDDNQRQSMIIKIIKKINDNQWKSMQINDYQWKSMIINDDQWLPMTVNDNQW